MRKNITPDKPFLTYEEMVSKLKNNDGLLIYDDGFAQNALQTLSYYNLINGYQDCFRDQATGKFKGNITIEFLCRFHYFDKSFQHIFLKYCTYIEDTFKNHISYVISKDFGVMMDDYLDPSHYIQRPPWQKRAKNIEETITNIRKNAQHHQAQNPTKYYLENHNHVPAWILFKNTNFTDVIDLYSFMKDAQKKQVLHFFFADFPLETELQKEFLKISITLIRKFRNRIAHNLKYYAFKPSKTYFSKTLLRPIAQTTPLLTIEEVSREIRGRNDVYAFLLALIFLLGTSDLKLELLQEIALLIQQDQHASLELQQQPLFLPYSEITGLPQDLIDRLGQYYNETLQNFRS